MFLPDFSQTLRPKQTARETRLLCHRSLPGHVTGVWKGVNTGVWRENKIKHGADLI